MTTVTFLQLRPSTAVSEIWASTRRREGTLVVEVDDPALADIEQSQRGGLLLASGTAELNAPAYVVAPDRVGDLVKRSVDGWRITIVDSGDRMAVADALAFSRAAFVRTARRTARLQRLRRAASGPQARPQADLHRSAPQRAGATRRSAFAAEAR